MMNHQIEVNQDIRLIKYERMLQRLKTKHAEQMIVGQHEVPCLRIVEATDGKKRIKNMMNISINI